MISHKEFLFLFLIINLVVLTKSDKVHYLGQQLIKSTIGLPKAVEDFVAVFRKEVQTSQNLTRLFHIGDKITPSEYKAGKVYLAMSAGAELGNENAAVDSLTVVRNYPSNRKKLADNVLIAVYSFSVAKTLFSLRALNDQNSHNLAKTYARYMESSYRKIANENYPRSKLAAVSIGLSLFLNSQVEDTMLLIDTFVEKYSNEWGIQARLGNIPDAKKKIPPLSSPPVNPLLKPDPKACGESKAVHKFHQVFSHLVANSKALSNLFKPLSAYETLRGAFYANLYLLQTNGVEDAATLADFISKYVNEKNTRNRDVLVSVFSKSRAKYLESEGVLNSSNAGSLAAKYARVIEDSGELIENDANPRSRILAVIFGSYKFLKELNAFDASRGKKLAFFFGNEWKCQG